MALEPAVDRGYFPERFFEIRYHLIKPVNKFTLVDDTEVIVSPEFIAKVSYLLESTPIKSRRGSVLRLLGNDGTATLPSRGSQLSSWTEELAVATPFLPNREMKTSIKRVSIQFLHGMKDRKTLLTLLKCDPRSLLYNKRQKKLYTIIEHLNRRGQIIVDFITSRQQVETYVFTTEGPEVKIEWFAIGSSNLSLEDDGMATKVVPIPEFEQWCRDTLLRFEQIEIKD